MAHEVIHVEVSIGVASAICNGVCLFTLVKERSLHTPHNVFIGNLTAIDLIASILIPVLTVLSEAKLRTNFYICVFQNTIILVLVQLETILLLFVTFERYIAVRYPIKYRALVGMSEAKKSCLVAWCLGVILGMIPMLGWNRGREDYKGTCTFIAVISYSYLFYVDFLFSFVFPLSVMIGVYSYIYVFLMRRENHRRTEASMENKEDTYRVNKYFVLVVLAFFFSKLPFGIINSLGYFRIDLPIKRSYIINPAFFLSHVRLIINPWLYALSDVKLQKAMLKLLPSNGNCCCKKQEVQTSPQHRPSDANRLLTIGSHSVYVHETGSHMSSDVGTEVDPVDPSEYIYQSDRGSLSIDNKSLQSFSTRYTTKSSLN